MTWQRIDENTYIDDTLVTCAEYQLFIDEMYEQKKYFQPDNWTSYRFPDGHAREPILGVRHADAVAFCKWLTDRESGKWVYQLPTKEYARKFLLASFTSNPLGYWLNENFQFEWVGHLPKDARGINPGTKTELRNARERGLNRPLNINLGLAINHGFNFDRTRGIMQAQAHAFDLALIRNLEIAHLFGDDREYILDLYFDILTLQERIAGRSPAFEGIRLVKELR